MRDYSQMIDQDNENRNDENLFESTSSEERELFRCVLLEALGSNICGIEEELTDMEIPPSSKRHKIRMNRLFRERVGGSFLPFPEVDTVYERMRSKLMVMLKTIAFFGHRKSADKRKNITSSRKKQEKDQR